MLFERLHSGRGVPPSGLDGRRNNAQSEIHWSCVEKFCDATPRGRARVQLSYGFPFEFEGSAFSRHPFCARFHYKTNGSATSVGRRPCWVSRRRRGRDELGRSRASHRRDQDSLKISVLQKRPVLIEGPLANRTDLDRSCGGTHGESQSRSGKVPCGCKADCGVACFHSF